MKNTMQLKAIIKNIAKEKSISAQIVLQNYMLERLLERISLSEFKNSFILKGGFLIASMVGLDTRTTMDIDATIKGLPVNEEKILQMFLDISAIEIDDNVEFKVLGITEIRETDEYSGFRVSITANYPPMAIPLKLDITTGDKITPKEIEYKFKLLTEDRSISILAYNLETILAEKLETIISRGDLNTRPRDFYDVYILHKLQSDNIDLKILKKAFLATCEKRDSAHLIENCDEILIVIKDSKVMHDQWNRYQKDFDYAKDILFYDVCKSIIEVLFDIQKQRM
ncbi:MAG: nucleotidyl transferase AbiEii/AbiGii toxin family protein [Clostridia bacterium]